jgi:hypothetical protein
VRTRWRRRFRLSLQATQEAWRRAKKAQHGQPIKNSELWKILQGNDGIPALQNGKANGRTKCPLHAS